MIISIPPLKSKDEESTVTIEEEPVPVIQSECPLLPTDGLRISEDQYILDPDSWFRNWSDFEDIIKIR